MPLTTMVFGVILVLLGVVGYFASGAVSLTAFIPSVFGLVLFLLGLVARLKEGARRHLMHAAAAVALVGLLGSIGGLAKLATLLGGGEVERPAAVFAQSIMAVLCVAFMILAVKSFVAARRARG